VTSPPATPRIYHITHVNNLSRVIAQGALLSDARVRTANAAATVVGMSTIKHRRLTLPVQGHPGLCVGDCVPFYFCPRSVMLFILHRGNHPEITYRGGQAPIVHLEADLRRSVAHLDAQPRRWAFTLANAGAYATEFRTNLAELGEVDWAAVANHDFRDRYVKESKQAEFLAEDQFEWHLIDRIGVHSDAVRQKVLGMLQGASHKPVVEVIRAWYY